MDPTVLAIPGYAASIAAERWWLRRRALVDGPGPADYEPRDTVTSLAMGAGSLVAPFIAARILRPITPGVGRHGRTLVAGAVALAAITTVADHVATIDDGSEATISNGTTPAASTSARAGRRRRRAAAVARRVASVGGVATVAGGGGANAAAWNWWTSPSQLWKRRVTDLGTGPLAVGTAMVGWDLIYYWNHRLMHECRALWAIHVVHHSSERYNLSTALRQPVADAFGVAVPTGVLSLLGVRPSLVASARAWNLIYQYWVHTEAIDRIGPAEAVLNSPSQHRVHHGSNQQYLDRNHGGILITWDRLFGTFEGEGERANYGLTRNINTFNPLRVATHEYRDLLADVAASRSWRQRLSHLLRGPGWGKALAGNSTATAAAQCQPVGGGRNSRP
jgi:sterol desaturase/sphingolipid hydroxylase (fatty acid hydroxylase superfamily)